MNIDNIIRKVLTEHINKIIEEDLKYNCVGDYDWPDFIEKSNKFIDNVSKFDTLINQRPKTKHISTLLDYLNKANKCIYKRKDYNNLSTDNLNSKYTIPLNLMYRIKGAMITSLVRYIKDNNLNCGLFCREDEEQRRILDFTIDNRKISFHVPQSLSYFGQLNVGTSQIHSKSNDNDKCEPFDTDYNNLLEMFIIQLDKIKTEEKAIADENANQQIIQNANERIQKGEIVPLFGDLNKPCAIKVNKKIKNKSKFLIGYNVIPNAYSYKSENYMLRDADGNWVVCDAPQGNYLQRVDANIIYMVEPNGKIISEHLIKNIVKQILKEYIQYGIHKNNSRSMDW